MTDRIDHAATARVSLSLDNKGIERFEAKVEKSSTCWRWKAAINRHGYGTFSVTGRMRLAHRVSYETYVAPIPERLDLDHLCRVRSCVRPDHLEPVTRSENLARSPLMGRGREKMHCPRGHAYSPSNTRITKAGARACRTCDRARWDTERFNPRVACAKCLAVLRKGNMKKHVARFHPEIRAALGLDG